MTRLDRAEIAASLGNLGVRPGSKVFVHSSLSSMGRVSGGADTVVAAFLDALGPFGTLMVPTFTYSGTRFFDVAATPSKTGAITEVVRRRSAAIRSRHPTHASCAIGPLAEWLMADDLACDPLGVGSPEDKIASVGGYVLLLGVGHSTNSTVHVGEAYAGAPSRWVVVNPRRPAEATVSTLEDGRFQVAMTSMPGCSEGFGAVEAPMRAAGCIAYGAVGDAACQLMRGADVVDHTVRLLKGDPCALLCDQADCRICAPAAQAVGDRAKLLAAVSAAGTTSR